MGMLEDLAGNLLGGGNQGGGNSMVSSILELVNNQPGGIAGLLEKFQQGGLGDVASSWIGTGQNLPISADQLQGVLGGDMLRQLAGKLGIAPETASSQLADVLPGLFDKLTPNGVLPQGDLMSQGMNLFQGFLNK
ncbi:MAG TPA: YidB family protein [Paludibaculum sp.]